MFHVTNQRAVSWFEFVREIVEAAGGDARAVRPIVRPPSSCRHGPPRGPANSVLANDALQAAGIPLLRDHSEGEPRQLGV